MEIRTEMGEQRFEWIAERRDLLSVGVLFVFLVLGALFFVYGQQFSHAAPSWVWGIFLAGSLYGFYLSSRKMASWVSWLLMGALGVRFLMDLAAPPMMASFGVKAFQRFVTYVFVFLPWALIYSAERVRNLPSFPSAIFRRLVILSGLLLFPFSLSGFPIFEAGIYCSLYGLLCLVAIHELKKETAGKRRNWFDACLVYSAPLIMFFVAGTAGYGRALLSATVSALMLYLVAVEKSSWLYRVTLVGSYGLGCVWGYMIQGTEVLRRFRYSLIHLWDFFVDYLLSSGGSGTGGPGGKIAPLDRFLPSDDTSAAASNFYWRLLVWKDGLKEWWEKPFFGIGYKSIFNSPSVKEAYPLSTPAYLDLDLHNSWIQVMMRGGLFVMIPFVIYWIATYRSNRSEYRIMMLFFFVYSLAVVSFETPHYALPTYIFLALVGLLVTPEKRMPVWEK